MAKAAVTDLRTNKATSRRTVSYRDAKGTKRDATVLGPGSSSGLKLRVTSTDQIIDNVPAATTKNSTLAWFARKLP